MKDQGEKAEPQPTADFQRRGERGYPAGPGKHASVRFVVVFVLLVTLFYVPYAFVSQTAGYRSTYLSLIAKTASGVLCVLGQETTAVGPVIQSPLRPPPPPTSKQTVVHRKRLKRPRGKKPDAMRKVGGSTGGKEAWTRALSFEIVPGCDGTEGFALFGSAVLASPFALRARAFFLVIGTIVLVLVNTFRIVTLFMLGVYMPDVFHSAHMDLWPGFIIVAVLICWLSWARWMMRRESGVPEEWE